MKLSDTQFESLYEAAMSAARKAGEHIQRKVGEHRETNRKEGGSSLASQVVTEVDLESQEIVLDCLSSSVEEYSLGVLTEESEDDSSRLNSDYFWCIDPLDGTLPFVEGTPGYSVSISLVDRSGIPVIGVVYDPAGNEMFHAARGIGSFRGNVSIADPGELGGGAELSWFMDRSMKSVPEYQEVVADMEEIAVTTGHSGLRIVDHAGAALNGVWVASQSPAIYFKLPKAKKGGGSFWDFAASACFVSEWGRPPADIHGDLLDLNRPGCTFMNEKGVLYASHAELSDAIIKWYRDGYS